MTKAERETSITMNDEDDYAEVSSFQRRMISRLCRNKAARKVRDIEMGGRIIGAVFEIPKNLIGIRAAKSTKRVLSDIEKQRLQKNLANMRQKRKEKTAGYPNPTTMTALKKPA